MRTMKPATKAKGEARWQAPLWGIGEAGTMVEAGKLDGSRGEG